MVEKVFWEDLEFQVPEGVYVPREDSYLSAEALSEQDLDSADVLDVGTGCGFLAIIAASRGAEVEAVDVNPEAVKSAVKNADRNDLDLKIYRSDLFSEVDSSFDLITFNAPYIPGEREGRDSEQLAWYGGEGGRAVIDRFIEKVYDFLNGGGRVLLTQTSLNNPEKTISNLEKRGFRAEVTATRKISWQELQVIEAVKV